MTAGSFFMAIETQRKSALTTKMLAQTDDGNDRFTDQLMATFGTTRRSEILGVIGDNGQPFEKQLQDYIDALGS